MEFTVHTKETAPEGSKKLLDEVVNAYGFLPNLFGVMAEAPMAGRIYMDLNKRLEETSLSATEVQIVLLTASYVNECTYCMAAHSLVAGIKNVPNDVIDSIRNGVPIADKKLEALRNFTASVTETRGWPSDKTLKDFTDVGYAQAQAIEVIIGVATKTLTNYINHLSNTPLDDKFQSAKWSKRKEAA